MTTKEIIHKVQEIARGWYWNAEIKDTRVENGQTITTLALSTANYAAPRRGVVKPFGVELVSNKPSTLIEDLNLFILGLMRYHSDDENYCLEEIEGFEAQLEEAFNIDKEE